MAGEPQDPDIIDNTPADLIDQALEPVMVEIPSLDDLEAAGDEKRAVETKPPKDAGSKALQEQLEATQRLLETERQRAADSEARAQEALRLAQDRDARARNAYTQTQDAQYDVLQSTLARAQSDNDAATRDLTAAREGGDFPAEAAAIQKMMRAQTVIANMEGAMGSFAEQRQNEIAQAEQQRRQAATAQQPQQQRAPTVAEIAAAVDSDASLLPEEREWIKKHPQVMTDKRLHDRMQVAYDVTVSQRLQRGTPEYMSKLNEIMGFKTEQPARTRAVSTPVTRTTSSNGKRMVSMSPAEIQMARDLGVTPEAWAKSKAISEDEAKSESYN